MGRSSDASKLHQPMLATTGHIGAAIELIA
jgi:hypothetical protein